MQDFVVVVIIFIPIDWRKIGLQTEHGSTKTQTDETNWEFWKIHEGTKLLWLLLEGGKFAVNGFYLLCEILKHAMVCFKCE